MAKIEAPELQDLPPEHTPELMVCLQARDLAAWCQKNGIELTVTTEIRRIEREAIEKGWPRERLRGPRFWPADQRGLAAVMDAGDQIAEVASDWISILKLERHILRFYR